MKSLKALLSQLWIKKWAHAYAPLCRGDHRSPVVYSIFFAGNAPAELCFIPCWRPGVMVINEKECKSFNDSEPVV